MRASGMATMAAKRLATRIALIVLLAWSIDTCAARQCWTDRLRGLTQCLHLGRSKAVPEKALNLEKFATSKYSEAFAVIDKHLRRRVLTSDLGPNLDELAKRKEMEARKQRAMWRLPRSQSGLYEQMGATRLTRADLIDAMQKLLDLRHGGPEQLCTRSGVKHLADGNRIALNPIERHATNRPYLLPRIGAMIVKAADGAALDCLEDYADELSRLLNERFLPDPEWVVLSEYCEAVMAFYLNRNGRPSGGAYEIARANDTIDVLENIGNMLEDQEILIGLKISDRQERERGCSKEHPRAMSTVRRRGAPRSNREFFEEYVMEPCDKYQYNVDHLFKAIKLYLPLVGPPPNELISRRHSEDVMRLWVMQLICSRVKSFRDEIEQKLDRDLVVQIDDERDRVELALQILPKLVKPGGWQL